LLPTRLAKNVVLDGDEPGKDVAWELERIAERFPSAVWRSLHGHEKL
jgi:hypothetical protein